MKNSFIRTSPDQSWLHGNYPNIQAEINTKLPYIGIKDYFWQGEEAEQVISEIHAIWVNGNMTIEQAIKEYSNLYL